MPHPKEVELLRGGYHEQAEMEVREPVLLYPRAELSEARRYEPGDGNADARHELYGNERHDVETS